MCSSTYSLFIFSQSLSTTTYHPYSLLYFFQHFPRMPCNYKRHIIELGLEGITCKVKESDNAKKTDNKK